MLLIEIGLAIANRFIAIRITNRILTALSSTEIPTIVIEYFGLVTNRIVAHFFPMYTFYPVALQKSEVSANKVFEGVVEHAVGIRIFESM